MTETPCWLKSIGSFNEMPRPYHRATEQLFWGAFFGHEAGKAEYRQVWLQDEGWKTFRPVYIWWFWSYGLAVAFEDGLPTYYYLGCRHEHRRQGEMVVCSLCGFSHHKPDSSD